MVLCASEVEDRQSERGAAENRRTQLQARKLEDEAVRCAPERGMVNTRVSDAEAGVGEVEKGK